MVERLPFVDAHVHLWDLDRLPYPWLSPPFGDEGPNGSVAAIARTYLLDDYLEDARSWDVRGIVHVDAGAHPSVAIDETRWLQGMAEMRGMPNAIVAFARLEDPSVDRLLAVHAAHSAVRGIRQIVNWHRDARRTYTTRDLTRDEGWVAGFARLARYGFSFDLQCYPAQMAVLAPLFARHENVPVVINHLGMPVPNDIDGIATWRAGMTTLAAMPHVSVKISGVGFAFRPWCPEQVAPLVREVLDLFGPRRCMVASDFPTDKLFGGFDRTLDAYAGIVADLAEDERRDLFANNANRIYRLGLSI